MIKFNSLLKLIIILVVGLSILKSIDAQTIPVTNTNDVVDDSDPLYPGSLRAAINACNNPGLNYDYISFDIDIPGNTEPISIGLNFSLPSITEQVTIDGSTQTINGYGGVEPKIEIYPKSNIYIGLYISADNSTIKDICINSFEGIGIAVTPNLVGEFISNVTIANCVIRNIGCHGCNGGHGILIASGDSHKIYGSFIGTNKGLTSGIEEGCFLSGISIRSTSNCQIGIELLDKNYIINNGRNTTTVSEGGIRFLNDMGGGFSSNNNELLSNYIYNNDYKAIIHSIYYSPHPPPTILGLSSNVLSGETQDGNDIVEIFGSTGPQNANEPLGFATVTGVTWSFEIPSGSTWDYYVATARNPSTNSNTSELSDAFQSTPSVPSNWVVTNTFDPNPINCAANLNNPTYDSANSLRWVLMNIEGSTATVDYHNVSFDIDNTTFGTAPHIITLKNPLEPVTKGIHIKGETEPDYVINGDPAVRIAGLEENLLEISNVSESSSINAIHLHTYMIIDQQVAPGTVFSNLLLDNIDQFSISNSVFTTNTLPDDTYWNGVFMKNSTEATVDNNIFYDQNFQTTNYQTIGIRSDDSKVQTTSRNSYQNLLTGIKLTNSDNSYVANGAEFLLKTSPEYIVRGIHIINSDNVSIGDITGSDFDMAPNPFGITSNTKKGVDVTDGSIYNLITTNTFDNLTQAIELNASGNESKAAPAVTSCTPTTVSGTTSSLDDIIEVYTSTTNQQALVHFGTVQAIDGVWTLTDVITDGLSGFVALAIDNNNQNTSELSGYYDINPPLFNTIWHVDLLGSDTEGTGTELNPFRTIQHAVNVSIDSDIVLVHQGTFEENVDIGDKYIQITSRYPYGDTPDHEIIETTIIKGVESDKPVLNIANSVPAGPYEYIRITGLTITNGYNPSGNGGGISVTNTTRPILEDLIIKSNTAQYGGGIFCDYSSELMLRRCMVGYNRAYHDGGGIYNILDTEENRGDAFIESSLIYRNIADNGGGVFVTKINDPIESKISFYNTTVANNEAITTGAGIYGEDSYFNMVNCIVYHHTGSENLYLDNCANNITYSCLEDGSTWAGTNCIYTDPDFVDEDADDYRLSPCDTECIGVGNPSGAPNYDVMNLPLPMPVGSIPDLGCHEYPLNPDFPPNVAFTELNEEYCSFSEAVTLTGYPSGGWFQGEGITNYNVFDPGLVTSTGPIVITYYYTDEYGCVYSSSQTTIVHHIDVVIKYTNPNCITPASGTIWVEVTGGSGTYSYHWTTTNGSIPVGQEYLSSLDPITAGTYVLEFTDLGHTLCDPLFISKWVPTANVEVSMENTGTCAMPTAQVVAKASTILSPWSPVTTDYTFDWYKDNGSSATPLGTDIQPTESTMSLYPGQYYVLVTDNLYQCSETKYFTVWETEELVVVIDEDFVVHNPCNGDNKGSAIAYATGGLSADPGAPNIYTYIWFDNTGTPVSLSSGVNGLAAGTYTVFVTINGCVTSKQVTITEPNVLSFGPTPLGISGCQVTAYAMGGTPPYTYTWEKKDENGFWQFYARTNSSTIYGLGFGEYRVTFTDANSCQSPDFEEFEITMDGITKTYDVCYRFVGFYELTEPEEIEKPEVPDFNVRDISLAFRDEVAECRASMEGLGNDMFEGGCENVFTKDELSIDFDIKLYHYTLYYYDRSGNLVRTVPPNGANTSCSTHNDHSYVTTYNYNNINQLTEQKTPDGGITKFWYNKIGQIRFSRNDEQDNDNKFSYTKYDDLGRILEVGESQTALSLEGSVEDENYPTSNNTQQVYTVYTTHSDETHFGKPQRFLQNRVSYTYNADGVYTYYSYDPHGNVEWMIQDLPGFGKSYISYEYDLISGNVTQVNYNTSFETDNFFHRYEYDLDNRLVLVESSRDGVIWDKDAGYKYYKHGPLKRVNLGEDKVQGKDYVYTIQGWLKAINHPSMDPLKDPGNSYTGNELFAKDAFAMSLGYFEGDYVTDNNDYFFSHKDLNYNLYNGNIASWTKNTYSDITFSSLLEYPNEQMRFDYRYDILNRIKNSDLQTIDLGVWIPNEDYATTYSYDANGNIESLSRNAHGDPGLSELDLLEYTYETGTNMLLEVEESASSSSPLNGTMNDIDGTTTYVYDDIGNLKSSYNTATTELHQIEWNVYGKISKITRTSQTIEYTYDASGNRIRKDTYTDPLDPKTKVSTYYVRDAQGNIMAVYERSITENGGKFEANYKIMEQPIYGSDRLGVADGGESLGLPIPYDIEFDDAKYDRTDNWKNVDNDTELKHWMLPMKEGIYPYMYELLFNEDAFEVNNVITNPNTNIVFINNLSVAEDINKNLKLSSVTVLDPSNNNNNICQIFNIDGNVLTGSIHVNSMADAQSVFMKKPGDNNIYYLITLGNDSKIYYHIIDMNLVESRSFRLTDQVNSNHVLADVDNYGHSFATLEKYEYSTNASSCILYYTVYNDESLSGKTELYAVELTESGFQDPILITDYDGTDNRPKAGDIQISPNGDQLAIATYADGETSINIEQLKSDYLGSSGRTSFSMNWDAGDYMSFDFAANPNFIYISVISNQTNKGLYLYDQSFELLSGNLTSLTDEYGSVRRGINGSVYLAPINKDYLLRLGIPFSSSKAKVAKYNLSSGLLALQPHKIVVSVESRDEILAQRFIGNKSYELNDHLGNVNSVISDLKEPQSIAGGIPTDFLVSLKSFSNYYPFGMMMPGRNYPGNTVSEGNYRFGYGGHEKDDEVKGSGNSYNMGARKYDPRIGRTLSIDPLFKKYPDVSPYTYAANNPTLFVDPDGKEVKAFSVESRTLVIKTLNYAFGKDHGFSFKKNTLIHNAITPDYLTPQQTLLFNYFIETLVKSKIVTTVKTNSIFSSKSDSDGNPMVGGVVKSGGATTFFYPATRTYRSNGKFLMHSIAASTEAENEILMSPELLKKGINLNTENGDQIFGSDHATLHEFAHAMVNVIMNEMGGKFNDVIFEDMTEKERVDWAIRYTNTLLQSNKKPLETGKQQHDRKENDVLDKSEVAPLTE
jgi:RHS repeat-associated protein